MASRWNERAQEDATWSPTSVSLNRSSPSSVTPKEPLVFDLKEALGLWPSSPSTVSNSSALTLVSAAQPESSASVFPPFRPALPQQYQPYPAIPQTPQVIHSYGHSYSYSERHRGMAHSSKAQQQCLRLCKTTAAAGDRAAERMAELAAIARHLPQGFDVLANDLIDTCQVFSAIEYGLGEIVSEGESWPLDMISVLDKKFRAAQRDFSNLDQMVGKQLEQEKKGSMGRWFSRTFGDSGLHGMANTLSKTREDLKISAFMFQWHAGSNIESEVGIGYIGLAAALDGKGTRRKGPPVSVSFDETHRPIMQLQQQSMELPRTPHPQQTAATQLGRGEPDRRFPLRNESLKQQSDILVNSIDSWDSPATPYTSSSSSSYFDPSHNRKAMPHLHEDSNRPNAQLEAIIGDISKLDLDIVKTTHIEAEPFNMPRRRPRTMADADKVGAKNALVAAIRTRDHRRLEQLLDRGVSPNTGHEHHALNEALIAQDGESVRLLLLYGADPNEPDSNHVSPLAVAAMKSFLTGALALLKYGADPNLLVGSDSDNAMVISGNTGNTKVLHMLLMYGGKPNQTAQDGNTLLIGSITKKVALTVVDLLLEYGADPNEKNHEGKTALFEAITSGRDDIVASLIKHKADPNLPGPKHMLWPSTYQPKCLQILLDSGATCRKAPGIMELATSINNIESIKILLKAGVDPNAKKDGVYTPLCTSIRDNRPEIFKLLLSSGADPNIPASEFPCFKCVTHHREQFLPALVAAGGNIESPKGILETAVTSNNTIALKWLLDQGINPDDKSPKGHTPLTSAIRESRIEYVKTLLHAGANPNIRGQDWPVCMAVHNPEILKIILAVLPEPRAFKGIMEMAVQANQLESLRILLAAGVSVEDRNGGVFSPLTTAIRERRGDIVNFLLTEGGADVNAPGEHLPIVKALRRCTEVHTEIIDVLLAKGADPNKMYRGWNGIMQALENGDEKMLEKICERCGVDLDVKDELGRNVTEIAVSRRWEEAIKILLRNAFEK